MFHFFATRGSFPRLPSGPLVEVVVVVVLPVVVVLSVVLLVVVVPSAPMEAEDGHLSSPLENPILPVEQQTFCESKSKTSRD